MSFAGSACADALPWVAGAVSVVLAATYGASRIAHRHSVIDTAWGLLFAAAAVAAFAVAQSRAGGHDDPTRRVLLLVLPVLWGLRLAQHIGRRSIGKPEDPRYDALLAKATGNRELYAVRTVYLLQGVLALLISAPILVGAFEGGAVGALGWLGVAVWVVGVGFEAVGDHQLQAFRDDPANRGTVPTCTSTGCDADRPIVRMSPGSRSTRSRARRRVSSSAVTGSGTRPRLVRRRLVSMSVGVRG